MKRTLLAAVAAAAIATPVYAGPCYYERGPGGYPVGPICARPPGAPIYEPPPFYVGPPVIVEPPPAYGPPVVYDPAAAFFGALIGTAIARIATGGGDV